MTRKLGFAGERDRYWIAVDDLVRWGRPRWMPRWRLCWLGATCATCSAREET